MEVVGVSVATVMAVLTRRLPIVVMVAMMVMVVLVPRMPFSCALVTDGWRRLRRFKAQPGEHSACARTHNQLG